MYAAEYREAFLVVPLVKEVVLGAVIDRQINEAGELVSETVVEPEVARAVPELPVPTTSWQIAIDGRMYIDGSDIPVDYVGRECLVHCTFRAEFMAAVQESAGYIPGVGAAILAYPRYAEFYPVVDESGAAVPFVPNCAAGYVDR